MATEDLVVNANQGVTVVTAEELGVKVTGEMATLPSDIQARAKQWTDNYKAKLAAQANEYVAKAAAGVAPQVGGPVVSGYLHWDLLSISPVQFTGFPPFQPSRIIASGEFALLQAVLFINPVPGPGGLSATTILGGRGFRVRFEQVNLTDVTNDLDITFVGVFPAVAPVMTVFSVFILAPNPGVNPRLVEMNVTADIVNPAQPFAAFATHHINVDAEPGFLVVPPVGAPRLVNEIPLRYLIYPK